MNADSPGAFVPRDLAERATATQCIRALLVRCESRCDAQIIDAVNGKNRHLGAVDPLPRVELAAGFAAASKTLEGLAQSRNIVDIVIADPWVSPGVDECSFIVHWHRMYPALSFIVMGDVLGERAKNLRRRLGDDDRILFIGRPFDSLEFRQLMRLVRVQSKGFSIVAPPKQCTAAAPGGIWRVNDDEPSSAQSRWAFERALDHALIGGPSGTMQHTLCVFAIDRFHVLLDRYGAAAQASMLRRVRSCIREAVRTSDRVARLGEEEFALLLPGTHVTEGAIVADKVLAKIRELRLKWRGVELGVTLSAGITDTSQQERKIAEFMSAAETALQAARAAGGDKLRVYRRDDSDLVRKREQFDALPEIEAALAAGRLKLYAQLIVPLDSQDEIHAELLVRMVDRDGMLWSPTKFLPVAERFGLAPLFDRWVFDRTLTLLRDWGSNPSRLGHVSVNLSGRTLMDAATLDWVEERYRAANLRAGSICFEITETAAIDNWSVASTFIDRMRSLGALFSLDDFGAGFSSFSYLEAVPTDYLKIDGSFVRQCIADSRQRELVRTLNEIGHLFGKKTIAEFVENDELLAVIKEIGVDCAQGYFSGEPFPAENLLQVIGAWRSP